MSFPKGGDSGGSFVFGGGSSTIISNNTPFRAGNSTAFGSNPFSSSTPGGFGGASPFGNSSNTPFKAGSSSSGGFGSGSAFGATAAKPAGTSGSLFSISSGAFGSAAATDGNSAQTVHKAKGLLREKDFWKEESTCAILNLNYDFLSESLVSP